MLIAGAKTVPMLEQCFFFKVEVSADQSEYASFFEPEGFQNAPPVGGLTIALQRLNGTLLSLQEMGGCMVKYLGSVKLPIL